MFDKDFFKFVCGFILILSLSFVVFYFIRVYGIEAGA
jgi:hypothetical protein